MKNWTIILIGIATLWGTFMACQCPPCPECPATPTPVPTATTYPVLWDNRLSALGITIEQVPGARYRLVAAWLTTGGNWDDVPSWAKAWQRDTLGGDHHVFGRAERLDGTPIMNKTFMLSWPGGADGRLPEPDGWANLPLAGQNWNPANGTGPYSWQALNGDTLRGIGLPHNHHYSFFCVWREMW